MRTTCCRPRRAEPVVQCHHGALTLRASLTALAANIAIVAGLWLPPARAQEATVPCALKSAPTQAQGPTLRLELVIDCTSGIADSQLLPRDADLLVGLTLFATPREPATPRNREPDYRARTLQTPATVSAALGRGVVSTNELVAGKPRWLVLDDRFASHYDAIPQPLRIRRAGERQSVVFTLRADDVGDRTHQLFAVWPKAAQERCDQSAPGARNGCRRNGIVLEGEPLAAYPGREVNHFSHPSGDWDMARWIVERFR